MGGEPAVMWRSEAPSSITSMRMSAKSKFMALVSAPAHAYLRSSRSFTTRAVAPVEGNEGTGAKLEEIAGRGHTAREVVSGGAHRRQLGGQRLLCAPLGLEL